MLCARIRYEQVLRQHREDGRFRDSSFLQKTNRILCEDILKMNGYFRVLDHAAL